MTEVRFRPLFLGHRGARAVRTIPENSMASFDRALADGCDGFEFDVRLSGDGEAVIWHDSQADGIEISQTPAHQLTQLARLEDVLARYRERAFLDIELKVAGLEKITVELLRRFSPSRGYVVSSFLPEVLRAVRGEDASIPLGLICETKAELSRWSRLPVEYVMPQYGLVDSRLVQDLKAAAKKVLVWTVNDVADMRRFRDWGVEGIISDETRLLSGTLA